MVKKNGNIGGTVVQIRTKSNSTTTANSIKISPDGENHLTQNAHQQIQINKHVLSNCSSNTALQLYTNHHDKVLSILTDWFMHNCKSDLIIYADLDASNYNNQVSDIFISLRPDIAILGPNKSIDVLELTICLETNMNKSRNYKETRYSNLHLDLMQEYSNYNLNKYTVEVTTLGLITDFSKFCVVNMKNL